MSEINVHFFFLFLEQSASDAKITFRHMIQEKLAILVGLPMECVADCILAR
uniref:Uncharacterized protein n=1 Tax=Octopus bimaculoides TaxID=37653 RepID=A0A0L8G6U6_OCTBM